MVIGNYTLNLLDIIIYSAILFIYFFGIYFCISPLIKVDRSLKSAMRRLDKGNAEYTDPHFLRCQIGRAHV